MGKVDQQYHSLLKAVKEGGYVYRTANRPSVDCHEIASATLQIPLTSAPIINTKEVKMKSVVEELLWFLRGDSSLQSLINKGVNIWNKDGYTWYCKECDVAGLRKISFEDFVEQVKTGNFNFDTPYPAFYLGDVGRNYGVQWRDWTHGYR
jgi:thymidylate synthase